MSNMKKIIQTLPPSAFAMVMATGIVATASQLQHFSSISNILFWLNNLAFFSLLLLLTLRLLLFPLLIVEDLSAHEKGAGFLTVVAGACVLGTEYAQAKASYNVAIPLLIFGAILWIIILYAFLAGVILKMQKPSPETGMNGSWRCWWFPHNLFPYWVARCSPV